MDKFSHIHSLLITPKFSIQNGLGPVYKNFEHARADLQGSISTKTYAIEILKLLNTVKEKLKVHDDKKTSLNLVQSGAALAQASHALHLIRVLVLGGENHDLHHQQDYPSHQFPKVYHLLREQLKSREEAMRVTIRDHLDKMIRNDINNANGSSIATLTVAKMIDSRLTVTDLIRCAVSTNLIDYAISVTTEKIERFVVRLCAEDFPALTVSSENGNESPSSSENQIKLTIKKSNGNSSPSSSPSSSSSSSSSPTLLVSEGEEKSRRQRDQLQHTRHLLKNVTFVFMFFWKNLGVAETIQGAGTQPREFLVSWLCETFSSHFLQRPNFLTLNFLVS